MALLIGLSNEVEGLEFAINTPEVTIGRSSSCTIQLTDISISHLQCSIKKDGNKYTLKNCSKTNITMLNGHEVTEIRIIRGDIIQVANIAFKFEGDDIEFKDLPWL